MKNYLENITKVSEGLDQKGFLDATIHVQATKDFKSLCLKTNYASYNNVHYQTLKASGRENQDVGDFLVLGHDLSEKQVVFPKQLIDVENPNMYVAVVCYSGQAAKDVYVFKSENFKKTGMFSMYKYNKNTDMFSIDMSKSSKLTQYSFGYVLKNI